MRDLCKERQSRNKISFANKAAPQPATKPEHPDTRKGEGYATVKGTDSKRTGTFKG